MTQTAVKEAMKRMKCQIDMRRRRDVGVGERGNKRMWY